MMILMAKIYLGRKGGGNLDYLQRILPPQKPPAHVVEEKKIFSIFEAISIGCKQMNLKCRQYVYRLLTMSILTPHNRPVMYVDTWQIYFTSYHHTQFHLFSS
ncbi:uncharacterized protein [Rutidosis leptorrhynchoides]|uniref:uncharacterized protein isoform X2 n=1 Tax=Rutidosis leptorrhynchoides TaxID=125765 RepID=UPI003A98F50B